MSELGYTRFNISRLELWLDPPPNLAIEITQSHQKFFQPVGFPQADFAFSGKHEFNVRYRLVLHVHHGPFPELDRNNTPLVQSSSFDLFQRGNKGFVFSAKEITPQRFCLVDQNFTEGDLFIGPSTKEQPIYPPGELEIRLFSSWLASLGDVILHASGIKVDGEGYCFLGEAGAGKSTLAKYFLGKPGVAVLGEDTIILRYLNGDFWIFGTPWHLNPELCSPEGVKLKKMFFLERSLEAGLLSLSPLSGVTNILKTAVIPYYHPGWLAKVLERLEILAVKVPFYSFSYQIGTDAWAQIRLA